MLADGRLSNATTCSVGVQYPRCVRPALRASPLPFLWLSARAYPLQQPKTGDGQESAFFKHAKVCVCFGDTIATSQRKCPASERQQWRSSERTGKMVPLPAHPVAYRSHTLMDGDRNPSAQEKKQFPAIMCFISCADTCSTIFSCLGSKMHCPGWQWRSLRLVGFLGRLCR